MRRFLSFLLVGALLLTACSSHSAATDTSPSTTASPSTKASTPSTTTEDTTTTEAGPCENVSKGGTSFDFDSGGTIYGVQLYVPTSFDGTPLPLVLNWHGLGSDGAGQSSFTGYETLAQRDGFIVVHPTGVPAPGDDRNSWELPQLDTPDRDDVRFAADLIDHLVATSCVDDSRVYSTGMSNGGFFTSRLVCELSDRIAAASSVAGTTHPEGCEPSRPVPYLSFHGTEDDVVGYDGGGSTLIPDEATPEIIEFFEQVMPDEFGEFAADFGCDAPSTTELTDEVTRTDYPGCDGDVALSFYSVIGGGHTWPGSPLGDALTDVLGPTTTDIDASELSWEFFQNYSLDS